LLAALLRLAEESQVVFFVAKIREQCPTAIFGVSQPGGIGRLFPQLGEGFVFWHRGTHSGGPAGGDAR
jgi:hypothetical protein